MACAPSMNAASSWAPVYPGTTGTPWPAMSERAPDLLPICRIVSGRGPTKTRPASRTAWAKSAFSLKNP